MKTAIKRENGEFLVISFQHVSGRKVTVNRPRTPKLWAIAHENGHKTRKRRVSGHIFPTCIRSEGHCKSPRTPKQWAIAHENGRKIENGEFLVISLKHVRFLSRHANPAETQKLWAITHENDHKTRKRRVFRHNSQTCTGS